MKIAVVRIGGRRALRKDMEDTLFMLNLPSKFSCAVVDENPTNTGMIKKVKDEVTFGPVNEETLKLLRKREKKGQKFCRLHPPVGGFEKKGTKKSFKEGGALGNRGEKINDLIKRMV
jgi:large subunit ribosomal protein L30